MFTSPEDLILIKLKWYKESESSRQREDIESILQITKNLDLTYLKEMTEQLGLTQPWNEIVDNQKNKDV